MILGLPEQSSYSDLLLAFPPRPIATEKQFVAIQEVIDSFVDKGELTDDEQDYLNVLGSLVYEYEEQTVDIPDIYGVDLLKALIEEYDLRQKDLVGIFKTESIISDVLHKKRSLTVEHIQKLSHFFHVSPAVFFELTFDSSQVA